MMKRLLYHPFMIRLLHWEYWNSRFVYAPLYPYWLWLSIKARSFFFLSAANPAIRNGGFIMESKLDVYELLPREYYPATLRFQPGTAISHIISELATSGIHFPCIAKPDIGERGLAVKKIHSVEELQEYATQMPVPFLVQAYVSYVHEAGIFYYRMPGNDKGCISGIVHKEPVAVTGDGKSTLLQLVKKQKRYVLQLHAIKALHGERLYDIPVSGEVVVLVPYGNHSRGSKFTDITGKLSPRLLQSIDKICQQIPGFYYGRLDVRYKDWQSLEDGTALAIIELNGSGSEPTHIYDPEHSIWYAWKEIVRHWNILYRISMMNVKQGANFTSFRQGQKDIADFKKIDAALSARVW